MQIFLSRSTLLIFIPVRRASLLNFAENIVDTTESLNKQYRRCSHELAAGILEGFTRDWYLLPHSLWICLFMAVQSRILRRQAVARTLLRCANVSPALRKDGLRVYVWNIQNQSRNSYARAADARNDINGIEFRWSIYNDGDDTISREPVLGIDRIVKMRL